MCSCYLSVKIFGHFAQNSKEGKLADRFRKASASHGPISMKQKKQMIKKQVKKKFQIWKYFLFLISSS